MKLTKLFAISAVLAPVMLAATISPEAVAQETESSPQLSPRAQELQDLKAQLDEQTELAIELQNESYERQRQMREEREAEFRAENAAAIERASIEMTESLNYDFELPEIQIELEPIEIPFVSRGMALDEAEEQRELAPAEVSNDEAESPQELESLENIALLAAQGNTEEAESALAEVNATEETTEETVVESTTEETVVESVVESTVESTEVTTAEATEITPEQEETVREATRSAMDTVTEAATIVFDSAANAVDSLVSNDDSSTEELSEELDSEELDSSVEDRVEEIVETADEILDEATEEKSEEEIAELQIAIEEEEAEILVATEAVEESAVDEEEQTELNSDLANAQEELEEARALLAERDESIEELVADKKSLTNAYCEQKSSLTSLTERFEAFERDSIGSLSNNFNMLAQLFLMNMLAQQGAQAPQFEVNHGLSAYDPRRAFYGLESGLQVASLNDFFRSRAGNAGMMMGGNTNIYNVTGDFYAGAYTYSGPGSQNGLRFPTVNTPTGGPFSFDFNGASSIQNDDRYSIRPPFASRDQIEANVQAMNAGRMIFQQPARTPTYDSAASAVATPAPVESGRATAVPEVDPMASSENVVK